jgi:hypothetical protein
MASDKAELYIVLEEGNAATFATLCSQKIVEGFAPLGTLTLRQVGQNVTYLQAFWRPNAVPSFIGSSP